ncbi:MAG TPA: hypothetical protein VIM71_06195 [Lacunisphaera sp.]
MSPTRHSERSEESKELPAIAGALLGYLATLKMAPRADMSVRAIVDHKSQIINFS